MSGYDAYNPISDELYGWEFSVLEEEPYVSIIDKLYFIHLAAEGKTLLGVHIIDQESVY